MTPTTSFSRAQLCGLQHSQLSILWLQPRLQGGLVPNCWEGSGCPLAGDIKIREVEEEEFREGIKSACYPQIGVSV